MPYLNLRIRCPCPPSNYYTLHHCLSLFTIHHWSFFHGILFHCSFLHWSFFHSHLHRILSKSQWRLFVKTLWFSINKWRKYKGLFQVSVSPYGYISRYLYRHTDTLKNNTRRFVSFNTPFYWVYWVLIRKDLRKNWEFVLATGSSQNWKSIGNFQTH